MKKVFKILLSSFALFTLISCVDQSGNENSNSSISQVYYHVVFKNYDEAVLSEIDVLQGTEAVYSGETPTRPSDGVYKYEFSGWDQDLTNILSDLTTKAVYEATEDDGWGPVIRF